MDSQLKTFGSLDARTYAIIENLDALETDDNHLVSKIVVSFEIVIRTVARCHGCFVSHGQLSDW